MKLNSKYSIPDYFRLVWSLVLTKIFFRGSRLIRQPTRIRGYSNMMVGVGFTTGQYCRIEAGKMISEKVPTLFIGDNVQINDRCHIGALVNIHIGNNVLIASDVFITDHDHGSAKDIYSLIPPPVSRKLIFSPVFIGDNVWIGEKVIILKGVCIGHNSIVAAGSVVTKNIPPFSVVAGNPAKIIKIFNSD